jgi:hypothetical protein
MLFVKLKTTKEVATAHTQRMMKAGSENEG